MHTDSPAMLWTALVTILACLVYFYMGINVGRMRGRHKIDAPAMTGHPEFERSVRVQMNTLEWLPIFFASLWLATIYFPGYPGFPGYIPAAIGFVWVIGRILYMTGYMVDAAKRSLGFSIQALATLILLILAVTGIVMAMTVV